MNTLRNVYYLLYYFLYYHCIPNKKLFYSLQFCVNESASLEVLSEGKTISSNQTTKESQTKSANLILKQVKESGNYLNAPIRLYCLIWLNGFFLDRYLIQAIQSF